MLDSLMDIVDSQSASSEKVFSGWVLVAELDGRITVTISDIQLAG